MSYLYINPYKFTKILLHSEEEEAKEKEYENMCEKI